MNLMNKEKFSLKYNQQALLREPPSVDNIYEFMKALYDCAQ